jgi:hypothetical protein
MDVRARLVVEGRVAVQVVAVLRVVKSEAVELGEGEQPLSLDSGADQRTQCFVVRAGRWRQVQRC